MKMGVKMSCFDKQIVLKIINKHYPEKVQHT